MCHVQIRYHITCHQLNSIRNPILLSFIQSSTQGNVYLSYAQSVYFTIFRRFDLRRLQVRTIEHAQGTGTMEFSCFILFSVEYRVYSLGMTHTFVDTTAI